MKLISASIVLYKNNRDVLDAAIQSFLEFSGEQSKLYLIDNSPTDALKTVSTDQRTVYYHNPSNPGFGAAHNIAIKMAMEEGASYHLVLNPDVYFEPGTLEKIVMFMDSNPRIGNLMPNVVYPDASQQYLCKLLPTPYDWIGRRFNPFKQMVERRNDKFELRFTGYNRIMDVPYLSGCFMFLRLSVIENIGGFDEGIFMYGEEADLCRRIISAGYQTTFFPEATIVHHFEKGSHKSKRLLWIGIKSAVYYFNKWGWLFDKERKEINRKTLKDLGYRNA
ncbi:glycosyltransferase family 2 protein [Pedobacter sp. SYP-B3415]|uniref:glycosyltransferase family 2 protein n=1 Tax=Pedobacter sp. SYP-B3415 TaxID=2496641 RepID=UPI00101C4515|nr:glycosyltransferase family 2 protein [Pedobacter sp. SYP-B3415]